MESMIAQSGKTKLHLCRAMGVSKTYLRDAKKQGTDISGEKLHILAAELNTTPEYLRGETDDPGIKKEMLRSRSTDVSGIILAPFWSSGGSGFCTVPL